jgi:hypothetical protein
VTYNASIGTLQVGNVFQLTNQTSLPDSPFFSPQPGSMAVSASAGTSHLYFYNGSSWVQVV